LFSFADIAGLYRLNGRRTSTHAMDLRENLKTRLESECLVSWGTDHKIQREMAVMQVFVSVKGISKGGDFRSIVHAGRSKGSRCENGIHHAVVVFDGAERAQAHGVNIASGLESIWLFQGWNIYFSTRFRMI
jgi:hypothetical protein